MLKVFLSRKHNVKFTYGFTNKNIELGSRVPEIGGVVCKTMDIKIGMPIIGGIANPKFIPYYNRKLVLELNRGIKCQFPTMNELNYRFNVNADLFDSRLGIYHRDVVNKIIESKVICVFEGVVLDVVRKFNEDNCLKI